jgi:diguanylate cyclase (GGDEF)-like protein
MSHEPVQPGRAAQVDPRVSPEPAGYGPARTPVEGGPDDQTLSDRDQTSADTDQTSADTDQTSADVDQAASERDQRASDRDQSAADRDQAAGVQYTGEGEGEGTNGYARTRRARSQSAHERDLAAHARTQTALARDEDATRRDRMATARDAGARARDEFAATIDADIEQLERDRTQSGEPMSGSDLLLRAAEDRRRAATDRIRAAAGRAAADRDRELAAADREQAARDRLVAAEELAAEGVDHLTGALRRSVGLRAMQREVDRTLRTGERLVVAFVDVDGLKLVNDTDGHGAGDDALCEVARAVTQHLRSYDVIARFGGDEFVCSLSGLDAGGARKRFERIRTSLSETAGGPTISVGLAERGNEDSLDQLICRADTAMLETRRDPEG